jgi:hypothetical protein
MPKANNHSAERAYTTSRHVSKITRKSTSYLATNRTQDDIKSLQFAPVDPGIQLGNSVSTCCSKKIVPFPGHVFCILVSWSAAVSIFTDDSHADDCH